DKVVFDGVSSDGTFSSGILSQVALGAEGNGGSVNIRAGSLEVKNGAQINSSTFSTGNAGNMEIAAEDKVVFDGISPDGTFSSGILSQVGLGAEGNAGDVTITARDLTVENGAQIAASTFGTGNAGSVEINATDTVVLDGGEAESFTGVDSSVQAEAEGDAEGVTITTGSLEVKNGAQINSNTFSIGNAGNMEITAEDTVVFDGISPDGTFSSGILSQVASGAEGNAGDVTITARDLTVENGAQIAASTFGTGNAGSVEINATDTVVLDGGEAESFTGVDSSVQAEAEGDAEGVTITTGSLEVKNG
ncbi:MAG: filamentous hemagglutinin, partial [Okeania sp. SIO3H1]|nr:filamentous hemagglutinin [Okeania sp. SIO3H1]